MSCDKCGGLISIYGYTGQDILKIDSWLRSQNATIKDLDCASLNFHYWERTRILDHIAEDFK